MRRRTFTITAPDGRQATAYAWNTALRASASLLPPNSGKWHRLQIVSVGNVAGRITWENLTTYQALTFTIESR